MPRRAQFIPVLLVLGFLSLPFPSPACNVPVFRYALEFWPPEPYELLVFHRNGLSAAQTHLLTSLKAANLRITSTDLANPARSSEESARPLRIWNDQTNAPLPWMVLLSPHDPDTLPVWTGLLNATNLARITDSPARQQVSQRLLSGESAVWIVLESGDAPEDDRISRELESHLQTAQGKLELPTPDPDDPMLHANLPLRIAFSVVRISRADPAEQVFIRTLLNGEPGLDTGAVAFPIFGQGRTRAAFKSPDLTERVVHEAGAFMAGPCSCEVKDLNPGKDLLFAADWNSIFNNAAVTAPSPPPAVQPASPVTRRLLLTAAGLASLIAITATLLLRRPG